MSKFQFVFGILIAAMSSVPAFANPINFDCDVPGGRFSSVTQEASAPLAVAGKVKMIVARPGTYLPVAGALLTSTDGHTSAGFQLIVNGSKPKNFDAVLNLTTNGSTKKYSAGEFPLESEVSFRISSDSRKLTLYIGGKHVSVDFEPIPNGKMMAFCSTGEFKFTGLEFTEAKQSK